MAVSYWSIATAFIVAVLVVLVFILTYYLITGVLPGSRMILLPQDTPLPSSDTISAPTVPSLDYQAPDVSSWLSIFTPAPTVADSPKSPPLADNGLGDQQAKFIYFYATWCPWSKKAQEPWSSFKQLVKNKKLVYGNYKISFEEVNGDSDKGKAALYNITAFPTFKLETKDKLYEMKGTPAVVTFQQFLTTILGPEKSTNGSA